MKKIKIVGCMLLLMMLQVQAGLVTKPVKLTCENFENPLGIDEKQPHFGWQIATDSRSVMQSAYRILVADNLHDLLKNNGNVWDSKKIESDQSIQVKFKGSTLQSSKTYFWKVMVWDRIGNPTPWSEISCWQMGLFAPEDWKGAAWIGFEKLPDSLKTGMAFDSEEKMGNVAIKRAVVPLFRKEFELIKNVTKATLFITGLGQYEARINGKKIGESFLMPGWTDFNKTVLYTTFDVSENLKKGANVIGVIVGNGFYYINRERYRKFAVASGMPTLICRLKVLYGDGTEENIVTGNDWKTSPSPITYTSMYGGEDYDAQLEQPGWDRAGYDDSWWRPVINSNVPKGQLCAETDYPVAIREIISTKNVLKVDTARYLYDFGQNVSGIIELKVKGKKGQEIRIYPGELLTDKNEINQSASGGPYYFTYKLKGDGIETWTPKFTYYGFRYAMVTGACPDSINEVNGLPKTVSLNSLHTNNSSPQNGSFTCSNELFNKTFRLINWAIKSNLQSVLTDCPHREKLGWLEQTYLMGNSINYNYDIYHLYSKLINDMMDSQLADGLVPDISPEYVKFGDGFRDSPEWGSASIILPWLVYKMYGDNSIIEKAWPMMVRYIGYLGEKSENNILSFGLGDWYDLGPNSPGPAQLTPVALTATSIYYYDLKLLTQMADVLHKAKDVKLYSVQSEKVKSSFSAKFLNKSTKVYSTGSQTSMSMPLSVGLVDELIKNKVVDNLVDSIIANNKALTAGDIGFHFLVDALAKNGRSQLIFDMNNRDDVPGYGFQLKSGATSLTESWMANKISSNNHLMLGHLMQWFYESIGGIQQQGNSIAFKSLIIKPYLVGDISSATSVFNTPYGTVKTDWEKFSDSFHLNVTIPANSTATVYLPVTGKLIVSENGSLIYKSKDILFVKKTKEYLIYNVGSGSYDFRVK